MAEEAAKAVLVPIIERVITPAVDAIGRQFGYIFCYWSNIKTLQMKVAQLEVVRNDADSFFEAQKRNNEERAHSSAAWLKDVKKVTLAAKELEEATNEVKGWCLNVSRRYKLSRKSKKLAAEIRVLQVQAPKGITTHPAPPAGMLHGSSSNDGSRGYETRMENIDEVMKALEDVAISAIGICGLGGVGKTTLVHEVRERARMQNLFDGIAMTTVSQKQDLFNIQGDIAEVLGLTSLTNEKNVIARADQLHKRLTNGSKNLVILDDVWGDIKLKDVGIPVGSDHTGCKVLITSRQEGVCSDIQKNIEVKVLSKQEGRAMFRKTAGDCVELKNLEEIANEVADECGGLPIALLTLARALSNKERKAWTDARQQLREGIVTSIHGMELKVYQSIMLSYEFLAFEKLKEAQALLLLCCQHPEDAEINVEQLARHCLALELFEGVCKFVHARNRVHSLIGHLKSCFLLQVGFVDESDSEVETVKMHDIVRDVCFSIVSRVKEERDKVYMHRMAQETDDGYELDTRKVDYPKVKLLVQAPLDSGLLNVSFLQQMQELRVFENFPEEKEYSLPALEVLTNLRMLSLEQARFGEDVMSTIGSLTKMEILSFMASSIGSFPRQIGQLSNLKLLDLRCDNKSVGLIPSSILPGLKKLEVLYLGNYHFLGPPDTIEEGIDGESHGNLAELDSLFNLTSLQIRLLDPMGLLELQHFCFKKLENFHFGSTTRFLSLNYSTSVCLCPVVEKTLELEKVGKEWVLEDKIKFIVRNTSVLRLQDIDWNDPLIIEKFVSLGQLRMTRCNQIDYIIHDGVDDATHSRGSGTSSNVFMNLESLILIEMDNVTKLCHNGNLPAGSLHKLQWLDIVSLPKIRYLWVGPTDPLCLVNLINIRIWICPELESIFPYSAAKCLVQLETLKLRCCKVLEGIFSKDEGTTTSGGEINTEHSDFNVTLFPKLRYVELQDMSNFRCFYNLDGEDGWVQPLFNPLLPQNLERVELKDCKAIKAVFDFNVFKVTSKDAPSILSKLKVIELEQLPELEHVFGVIPKELHGFRNLEKLNLCDCGSLTYLLPSSIAHMLMNLKDLTVVNCKSMKEVMKMDWDCGENRIVFHSLHRINLGCLEKLVSFCSSDLQEFEFPLLEKVMIVNCPVMRTFCCGHLTVEKLKGVHIAVDYDINNPNFNADDFLVWKSDINETVHHFNVRLDQTNSDLIEDNAEDGDSIHAPVTDAADEYHPCVIEDSNQMSPLSLPLVDSSADASLVPAIVSPSPPPSDNNEELAHSSTPDLENFALRGLIEIVPLASTKQSVSSSDSRVGYVNASDLEEDDIDDSAAAADIDEDAAADDVDGSYAVAMDVDNDENVQCDSEAFDHSGTSSSTLLDQATSSKPPKASLAPAVGSSRVASLAPAIFCPPPPVSENKDEVAHSSSPDLVKVALPGLIELPCSAPSENSVPTSDSSLQTKIGKKLSDTSLSTSHDDWKRSRFLLRGVYIKAEMKTTLEEILTAYPNFLSGLRFKKADIKTVFVESAVSSLQSLRQYTARTISQLLLASIKDSLDDLAASGLDMTWLERGYQRASFVMKEQKAVLAATELARLERKKVEAEGAFEMAKAELEEVMQQRDASKSEFDALLEEVDAGKELFGGGFDTEAILGDALSVPLVGSSPNALPRVVEILPSASTEQSAPSSDSPIQNFNASLDNEQ